MRRLSILKAARVELYSLLAVFALATLTGDAGAAQFSPAQRATLLARVPAHQIQADTDGNKLFDNLEARMAATPADQPLEVVVRYKEGQQRAAARIAGRASGKRLRDNSLVAALTPAQIRSLAASGAVESIEADTRLYATRGTADASFGTAAARLEYDLSGNRDGDGRTYSPRDVTIAVLDTGIDPQHPDFAGGKILAWKDFVNGRLEPYDDNGHGTHVASIAAGAVVNGVGGVAPEAALVVCKVLKQQPDGRASGSSFGIAAAVDWCVENKERYGIDIINMSLGGSESSDGTDVVSRAVDRASTAGIVVFVSAGNEGPGYYTVGSPGAARSAITVGNMRDLGKDGFALVESSSRGPTFDNRVKPDLCAPGYAILAANANHGGYLRMTGTSMASPFAAGVAALMLEANPKLTPDQVKQIMRKTAVRFGRGEENFDFGAGRLDAYAAVASVVGRPGTRPEVPNHLYGQGRLPGNEAYEVWEVSVSDTRFPLAVTLIMHDGRTNFDLYVYDESYQPVTKSDGGTRQETVTLSSPRAGKYYLMVRSRSGAGHYWIDISAGSRPEPGDEQTRWRVPQLTEPR